MPSSKMSNPQMESGVSVIVCCYNSESLITDTLYHIAGQKTNTLSNWELIIVDNNCTDNTIEKAVTVWESLTTVPLHIIEEKKPGLMHARIAGVSRANFSFIVFCDDDNHLDKNYLQKSYEVMNSDKKIGVVGGISEGVFETEPPKWFKYLQSGYAVGEQAEQRGDITDSKGHVWGAGMVCRTEVMRKILSESFITSGRKGNDLLSGDDTEICYKVIKEGYRIVYEPELSLKHLIVKKRLNWKYAIRMEKGHVKTVIKLADLKNSSKQNKEPVSQLKNYKDFLYLLRSNFTWSTLTKIKAIKNIQENEGDIVLWKRYFSLYYLYYFFLFRILKRS
jgi:glycosyltransferase involved in cell wall biosynthesis